jgi:hypothetical protein
MGDNFLLLSKFITPTFVEGNNFQETNDLKKNDAKGRK